MQDGNQARGMSAEEKLLRMQAILFVLTGCSHLYVHSPCTHQKHPYWMRIMWPSATPHLNQVGTMLTASSSCHLCAMRVYSDAARFSAPEYRPLFDSPDSGLTLDDLKSNEAIEQRAAEFHHAAAKANKGEGQKTT